MADKSSFPAQVLKKTLRLFMVAAVIMSAASLGLSRLFTEDVVVMAEKTSRENQQTLWQSYQHYYMEGGKVYRPKDKFDTVSEGQAYAMLRAVWLNDQETFNKVYRWTEDNLSRQRSHGDHLLAWRYGIDVLGGSRIIDDNSAIDADLDYALALFLASKLWQTSKGPVGLPTYRDKGIAVAESIMRKAMIIHPNGEFVLNPWPMDDARSPERDFLINPSYFSPGHYRIFEAETGDPRWGKMANDSYTLLNRLLDSMGDRADQVATIPDWILMRQNGLFAVDQERGYVSGWDAFRLWWRLRLDYGFTGNPVARDFIINRLPRFLAKSMLESGGEVASESNRDGTPINKWSSPAQTAVFGWAIRGLDPNLERSLQRQAHRRLQRDGQYMFFQDKEDYYTNSWAWLSMTEGELQFPFDSLYRLISPTLQSQDGAVPAPVGQPPARAGGTGQGGGK